MTDLEKDCESTCDDSLAPSLRIGDCIDEYNRIYDQILALECWIDTLDKNRQQLKISAFDRHIHQLNAELCMLKTEIEPIILILCEVISQSVLEKDKEYLVERIFLHRTAREIAVNHNVTDQSVSLTVSRYSRIKVPNDIIEKYGKVFKE